ncbi:DUF2586 family protein [Capnocytophaga canis]|uniref:DUF2586 family protein n=1 Tax=Capnocytophaga canis TaxID=1848903 RepID=UPI0015622576|nr:DUF2586 family protein [Capnocytophaga canis]
MSNLKGVIIEKGRLGANTRSTGDNISGLIVSAPKPSGLELDTPTVLYKVKDATKLGISEDAEGVNLLRHIKEFYRMAGEGTPLHLMVVAQSETMPAILENKAKKLLVFAKGEIRQLAVAINSTGSGEFTMLNGLPQEVYNAVAKAQGLADWAYENFMPCQIFLEGYGYGGNASSSADLRKISNLNATKVSVVIGQDFLHAKTKTGNAQKYADVGTVLGVCSKALVNQNIGNNELFNLTDATKEAWIEPGLSSHKTNVDSFEDLQTLEDKGYIFGTTYAGMAGVRINNDHVCAEVIVDSDNAMNEHTIAYGRVMDKASRSLRTAYLPKVKTDWELNEKGKMRPATVAALEDIGDNVLSQMLTRGEISFGKTTIDKDSDLVVEKVLKVAYVIVPKGSIGEIKGTINLKTQA